LSIVADCLQKAAYAFQSGVLDPYQEVLGETEGKLHTTMQYSLHGVPEVAVHMFLDVACVLHGRRQQELLLVWRQWHGAQADSCLRLLKNRNLVSGDGGALRVHDVLRWFGRRVVSGVSEVTATLKGSVTGSRLWIKDNQLAGYHQQPGSFRAHQQLEPHLEGTKRYVLSARLDVDRSTSWRFKPEAPPPEMATITSTADFSRARVLLAGRIKVDISSKDLVWLEMRDRLCPQLAPIIRNKNICILRLVGISGLSKLPDELRELTALQTLDLSGCSELTELPTGVGRLGSLRTLDLGECDRLRALPDELTQLSGLQTLNLKWCMRLTRLPKELGRLSSLQTLDLGYCEWLNRLPEEVGLLRALQVLRIKHCYWLTALPDELQKLSGLQTLDLGRCSNLRALPEWVGKLSKLQELLLDDCGDLIALPEEWAGLAALHALDLQGCRGLNELPKGIGKLGALQTLNLQRCHGLSALPEELAELTTLQTLHITGCRGLHGWQNPLPDWVRNLQSKRLLRVWR
jgi:hypothetical protein